MTAAGFGPAGPGDAGRQTPGVRGPAGRAHDGQSGRVHGGTGSAAQPVEPVRSEESEDDSGPVIHDRRKIDPVTGQVRASAQTTAADSGQPVAAGQNPGVDATAGDALAQAEAIINESSQFMEAQQALAELTEDLQRLQAEYVNYRKRVDRDRAVAGEQATTAVIASVIPVLDDIDAARQAGDLAEGPFASIAAKLEAALGQYGLERYGEAGEIFDPAVHEALMHQHSDEVTQPTVSMVIQPGYRLGKRVVRPARVTVAGPEE